MAWPTSGEMKYSCGRNGEAPSQLLGDQLRTSRPGLDAAQDRHAAPAGWPHDRLESVRAAARRCDPDAVLISDGADRPATDPVPHRLHHRRNAASPPGGDSAVAALQRPDRRRRPALLPVDRRQVRQVPGQAASPDFSRTRGPGHQRGLRQWHVDQHADRCAERRWSRPFRAWKHAEMIRPGLRH